MSRVPSALSRFLPLLLLSACREGSEQSGSFLPIVASTAGTQSCAPSFGPAPAPLGTTEVFADVALFGPLSQVAALRGGAAADVLLWTASDGSVHELTLPSGGGPASDAVVVPAGTIETEYLVPAGILAPAELSGIAVVDSERVVLAEHASNTLIVVHRVTKDVFHLAGVLDEDGGFGSGQGDDIRFHFTTPVPLLVDVTGLVWVADTENHAVRQVLGGALPSAVTVAGSGAPGAGSGALALTRFDTLSGIAASCAGELLVVESGGQGVAGHVLKSLRVGSESFFGGFDGSSLVLAGDGTPATVQGVGGLASLGAPMGLAASEDGSVYWVDALAPPVLRRYAFATGLVDCPMFSDCASAVPGALEGEAFSVAVGESGALYVLGTTAGSGGKVWRIEP
jgi:hypothetical protein